MANLEQKWVEVIGKHAASLAERRRQDVRDQAEEITSIASQFSLCVLLTIF